MQTRASFRSYQVGLSANFSLCYELIRLPRGQIAEPCALRAERRCCAALISSRRGGPKSSSRHAGAFALRTEKIRAERQLCPTGFGGNIQVHPMRPRTPSAFFRVSLVLFLLLSCVPGPAAPRLESSPLFDDFQGTNLDSSRWLIMQQQWGVNNGGVVRDNVAVSGGLLHLIGRRSLHRPGAGCEQEAPAR